MDISLFPVGRLLHRLARIIVLPTLQLVKQHSPLRIVLGVNLVPFTDIKAGRLLERHLRYRRVNRASLYTHLVGIARTSGRCRCRRSSVSLPVRGRGLGFELRVSSCRRKVATLPSVSRSKISQKSVLSRIGSFAIFTPASLCVSGYSPFSMAFSVCRSNSALLTGFHTLSSST